MKLLDASAVFAILSESGLIDRILRLGHVLAITSHVLESEIIDPRTRRTVYDMEREGKITIIHANKRKEVEEFMEYHTIGAGESDVMLTYEKMAGPGDSIYCIIDERKATRVAEVRRIPHGGLARLFWLMVVRHVMTRDEARRILRRTRRRGFRITDDLIEWACAGQ